MGKNDFLMGPPHTTQIGSSLPLHEALLKLKFGRPAEAQKFLDVCAEKAKWIGMSAQAKWAAQCVEKGLCYRCGQRKATVGTRCDRCARYQHSYYLHRTKFRREEKAQLRKLVRDGFREGYSITELAKAHKKSPATIASWIKERPA